MMYKPEFRFLVILFFVTTLFMTDSAVAGLKNPFQSIPGTTESVIAGVNIRYFRDSNGCAEQCEFYNDPKRCGDNAKCLDYAKDAKAKYESCQRPESPPRIGKELVKSAGYTTGTTQLCDEFTITTHGSPGWTWNYFGGGNWQLVCIGYYYAPANLCCDPTGCVPKP